MSEIRVDTISEKTSANGVAIDSVTLKDGGIDLADSKALRLGTGNDLTISFDGTDSVMDHTPGSGGLYIRSDAILMQDSQSTPNQFVRMDQGSGVIFNDGSLDHDFRVESNDNEYALYVDAGSNEVGIGVNPSKAFHTMASANDLIVMHHNTQTSGNVFGLQIDFSSTVDDNTSYFFRCLGNDRATVRAVIYSDGDIQNADNSYGSTSDERIKEQIKDANSQWDDIKALKIKNYKLKEDVADKGDSDDLWRLGVIAQDLEAAGMNGLVKPEVKLDAESPEVVNGEGNVGDIRDYKGVKYSILYMKAVKALQEAMTRIEILEAEVSALKG